ncbi:leukotriene B4 receptor 2a isoform X2 [Parambassis ranga]|uniref:Leukotriene B4 receptor 2a isoform X2 n=1 Tax=Parambassis ranga TaxID=210632 RepID=A0A6P7I0V0_9TELE|nr:leukotriene B4 receptor 1-like isoform X2 [Parambassis ranga]
MFADLISSLQMRRSEVKQLIKVQEQTAIAQVIELQLQLVEEITKLKENDAELEQLAHVDDFIYLMQIFQSLSTSCDSPELTPGPLRSLSDVTDCVSELRDKIELVLKEIWPRITATVSYVDFSLPPAPNTREEFLCYYLPLTLDDTSNLPISLPDGQQLPDQAVLDHQSSSSIQVIKMDQNNFFSGNSTPSTLTVGNETIVDSQAGTKMGAFILSLVFLLGFPGNLFVIWSILARARKQSVTTLLILNLAIADGSLMALTPFFIAYLLQKNWIFGNVMCKLLFYLCLCNMYASIHIIMLMSIYRLVAVLLPQRVGVISRPRTVRRMLVVLWVLVMVASVTAAIFREVRPKGPLIICQAFHDLWSYVVVHYMLELVLGFLIPYVVIIVSYVCILRRIRQTKFQRRIRSEKLILAIVLTFCLFWLPYHVINMVQVAWAFCPDDSSKKILLEKIWQRSRAVTSSIAFISSCANPVLYFFAGKSYIRREGLAFMARLFEGTGMDSSRKSRQNSQNSREKDKDADAITLKDKDQDSVTNSSSTVKPLKGGK